MRPNTSPMQKAHDQYTPRPADSREEADVLGKKTYFGKPCPKCDTNVRYLSSGSCKACKSEWNARDPNKYHFIRNDRKLRELEEAKDDYYDFDLE